MGSLQQVTFLGSGKQKPKIQGSYKEHQLGQESGPGLPMQLSPHSNPAPPLPFPQLGTALHLMSRATFPLISEEKCPTSVQAAVAASEKQLLGTFSLQDPVPALGFVIRVSQCSACRVNPILPATHGPVPPPLLAEAWPHSTKRALAKVISVRLCHQQWRHRSLSCVVLSLLWTLWDTFPFLTSPSMATSPSS